MNQNEVKYHFLGTVVLEAKKTLVLVLIPGLFDRSWSRTVDTLVRTSFKCNPPIPTLKGVIAHLSLSPRVQSI